MPRRLFAIAGILAAVIVVGWWLTPPPLEGSYPVPKIPTDIDAWLAESERAVSREFALIPGTEKRVRWQQGGVRTPCSVVYLHGFSATRQEIAPTAELIADALGANLFETRLTGHGHGRQPMHKVRAEDWLHDGVEAVRIGALLGDQVIVIGTSTGATLAVALGGHPVMQNVSALVLISPNMAPADPNAAWMTRPAGPLLARLIAGDTRSWTAHNAEQERYWSTSYPIDATVEVMRLVDRANKLAAIPRDQSVLMLLSPADTVVSPTRAKATFAALDTPRKLLVEVGDVGDPSKHIIAGDILSPETTNDVVERVLDFIRASNVESSGQSGSVHRYEQAYAVRHRERSRASLFTKRPQLLLDWFGTTERQHDDEISLPRPVER